MGIFYALGSLLETRENRRETNQRAALGSNFGPGWARVDNLPTARKRRKKKKT